jgi:hypothetical protein
LVLDVKSSTLVMLWMLLCCGRIEDSIRAARSGLVAPDELSVRDLGERWF